MSSSHMTMTSAFQAMPRSRRTSRCAGMKLPVTMPRSKAVTSAGSSNVLKLSTKALAGDPADRNSDEQPHASARLNAAIRAVAAASRTGSV